MRVIQAIFFSTILVTISNVSLADDKFTSQIQAVGEAKSQTVFINDFSKAAATGDASKLLELTWSAVRQASGDNSYTEYFKNTIIPYFSNFDTVDTYEGLSSIVMKDEAKTSAIVHFGYIRDTVGKRKPFEMVVVSTDKGFYLANIIVGRCLKGRHPICE